MASEVKVDLREWNSTFKEYMTYSKRTLAEALNEKGWRIAIKAIQLTHKADKSEIEALKDNPLFYRHINQGRKPGLSGDAMRAEVERRIQKRKEAINFLRAGWHVAVGKFAIALGKPLRKNTEMAISKFTSKSGDLFGDAKVAKPGIIVDAEMENHAFAKRMEEAMRGMPNAQEGLQKAFDWEVSRMKIYIERKMQETTNRIVGRFIR